MHQMFLDLGLKSTHSRTWDFENYQCFLDSRTFIGEVNDFTKLYERYPDSLFILNTRNTHDWIKSLHKHINRQFLTWKKETSDWPPSAEYNIRHFDLRKKYHSDVLNFFQKDPSKLIVVSIDRLEWMSFVAERMGYVYNADLRVNVRPNETIRPKYMKLINKSIWEAYDMLNYTQADKRSLHLDNDLVKLYKNNL